MDDTDLCGLKRICLKDFYFLTSLNRGFAGELDPPFCLFRRMFNIIASPIRNAHRHRGESLENQTR